MVSVNNIERFRKARGWSRPKLAEKMGTSYQQIEKLEKGTRRLAANWIERAAAAFEVAPAAIITEGLAEALPPTNATPFPMEGASSERMSVNLPIFGTALGAEKIVDGDAIEQTYLNQGEVIGYAKRPIILDGNAKAYGLYVQGSSMSPAHEDGALILAEKDRPLRIGDDVVVYIRVAADTNGDGADDGERARMVMVKRLVRRTAQYVELKQFTPDMTFRVPMDDVLRIDRVFTLGDLLS